ncbi:MAG: type I secretion system permease/ATPase [Rubrivivax sp.]|nr:type I secretion system permease/ATPase [Rubrivivax sp.]
MLKRVAGFSFVSSVLVLAPSLFMLEVYERVVNSRSHLTLAMLLLAVVLAYVVMEMLELVRARLLRRVGLAIDAAVRERLFDVAFEANLRRLPGGTTQAFNDLRSIREFAASPAVTALFDSPASVLLLVLLFLMSPWLGVMALVAAALQAAIAVSTERRTMPLLMEANRAGIEAQNIVSGALRNAQVIEAMGMGGAIHARWRGKQRTMLIAQADASDSAGRNNALSKLLQTLLGSLLLGMACWLTLRGQLAGGAGMMIVASILGARVLAPMVQLVAQWRMVANVRDAWQRLERLLMALPEREPGMALPAPRGALAVEALVAVAPGSTVPILRGLSFEVSPGEVVAVVGPSASGKTTLARLLVGVWPPQSGKVRLDGADVATWHKSQLGPYVGYLPQSVELLDGTIAENIARFGAVDMHGVRAAAEEVGIAGWIDSLPDGYDTRLGEDGANLSGGQRQRVALARAIYGGPRLIVLDEPNASLDEAGEKALADLLGRLKAGGATVIAITHRVSLLAVVDKMLVLREGQLAAFGARDEVLAALTRASAQVARPLPSAVVATGLLKGGGR